MALEGSSSCSHQAMYTVVPDRVEYRRVAAIYRYFKEVVVVVVVVPK